MILKRHFAITTFLFSTLCLSACTLSQPQNTPMMTVKSNQIVAHMEKLLKSDPNLSKTLILVDLDDTLFKQKQGKFLGTSDMYYFLKMRVEKEKGLKAKEAIAYIDPILMELYRHLDLVLTDNALPTWVESVKKRGATLIGFTARSPSTSDVTQGQLKKLNIKFSPINMTCNTDLFIKNGLYSIGQNQTKGQALDRLLASSCCTIHNQIIYLDDRISHLNHAAEIMRKYSTIKFTPILITPSEKTVFDPQKAMEQLCDFFNTHQKEAGLQALITQGNPWTIESIKACQKKSASTL